MKFLELVLIALGLSMDAFAVSISIGLSVKKPKHYELIIPGVYFGFFQALMTFVGYFSGTFFATKIQYLDHWIAFILLSLTGGKMILESFSKTEKNIEGNPFLIFKMLLLSIATSIDALIVGITLPFFEINILSTVLLIGLITFFLSIIGVKVGNICGKNCKSKAQFIGGAILITLGLKVLIEHLFFS